MDERIKSIRMEEERSHKELYEKETLYAGESWLKKPVNTVMELLGQFDGRENFTALDLGCGVGRNAVAIALHFRGRDCQIDCVDLLPMAVEKLLENGKRYGVEDALRGVVSSIEAFPIREACYDLILAVSALEHAESEEALKTTLAGIAAGVKQSGLVCLIMNTAVKERDIQTGQEFPAQFEVNLPTKELKELLDGTFKGWEVLKETEVPQRYEIPRGEVTSLLETVVVTYVCKKR